MSGCPAFEKLSASIDGDLPSKQESALRRHLESCAACRRQVDALTALKRVVGRAYDNEVPAPALRRTVSAGLPKRRRRMS